MLFVDFIGYNEIFKNVSIDRIFENLYLDIYTDDKVETLHLNIRMDFSNNYISAILTEKNKELSAEEAYEASLNEVPEFISENFTLENGTYYYGFEYNGEVFSSMFVPGSEEIIIFSTSEEFVSITYFTNQNTINIIKSNDIISYNYTNNSCENGSCTEYNDLLKFLNEKLFSKL